MTDTPVTLWVILLPGLTGETPQPEQDRGFSVESCVFSCLWEVKVSVNIYRQGERHVHAIIGSVESSISCFRVHRMFRLKQCNEKGIEG